jgi:hypothetical protein
MVNMPTTKPRGRDVDLNATRLKKALGVDDFFFERKGNTSAKFFFQKFRRVNSSRQSNWHKMAIGFIWKLMLIKTPCAKLCVLATENARDSGPLQANVCDLTIRGDGIGRQVFLGRRQILL